MIQKYKGMTSSPFVLLKHKDTIIMHGQKGIIYPCSKASIQLFNLTFWLIREIQGTKKNTLEKAVTHDNTIGSASSVSTEPVPICFRVCSACWIARQIGQSAPVQLWFDSLTIKSTVKSVNEIKAKHIKMEWVLCFFVNMHFTPPYCPYVNYQLLFIWPACIANPIKNSM